MLSDKMNVWKVALEYDKINLNFILGLTLPSFFFYIYFPCLHFIITIKKIVMRVTVQRITAKHRLLENAWELPRVQ